MARKRPTDMQLSLFDDSFFDIQPPKENRSAPERSEKSDGKEALLRKVEELASKSMEKAEKRTNGSTITIEHTAAEERGCKDKEKIRVRRKRLRLKVTFEDGTEICDASATQTLIEAIWKIGIERVANLNMEVCHIPLVSKEIHSRYKQWTKVIGNGWYLMAQSDTRQKYMQLASIINQLGIPVKVELGDFDTIEAITAPKPETNRKKKTQIEVKIEGTVISHGTDMMHTFLEIVERIGMDKVKKTNIKVGKFPIVTHDKVANNQIKTSTGEWLTVPTSVKDKYKVLRVISSMTHIPMEIKIIE